MARVSEIPLVGRPQRFAIELGATPYILRFQFRVDPRTPFGNAKGTWILDIADMTGAVIVGGIPLVTGANLLEQYDYLNFDGQLWVSREGSPETPTFDGLGTNSHVYWVILDESDRTSGPDGVASTPHG